MDAGEREQHDTDVDEAAEIAKAKSVWWWTYGGMIVLTLGVYLLIIIVGSSEKQQREQLTELNDRVGTAVERMAEIERRLERLEQEE